MITFVSVTIGSTVVRKTHQNNRHSGLKVSLELTSNTRIYVENPFSNENQRKKEKARRRRERQREGERERETERERERERETERAALAEGFRFAS